MFMAMTASAFFSKAAEDIAPEEEEAFFRSLKVRNRNTKQTAFGRLAGLNEALHGILKNSDRPLRQILDVGVSSGVTTVELYESLAGAGIEPQIVATDLSLNAAIVSISPGCRALVDASGDVLQYDVMGRAIRPWRRRLDYVSGMLFVRGLLNRSLAPAARRALEKDGAGVQKVKLVRAQLLSLPNITVLEDDVLKENASFLRRFDFIRAANVLNKEYFAPAILKSALAHLVSYLSGPGAILAIARTVRRTGQHATFFELDKAGARLSVIERVGDGSEIEELALSTVSPAIRGGAP
jgi:hypothetical protein